MADSQRPGYETRAFVDGMGHPQAMPVGWLGSVLLIRLVHLLLIGDAAVPFNNARLIVQAKAVVFHGIGDAFFSVSPAPNLLLAGLIQISKWPAGHAFFLMCMLLHGCLALAFWYWLSSLRWPTEINRGAMWVFAWIPALNSYEGFDNIAVIGAAAGFFVMAGALYRGIAAMEGISLGVACALFVSANVMVLFRAEHLLFSGIYFTTWISSAWFVTQFTRLPWLFLDKFSLRRGILAGVLVLSGLGTGVGLVIWIRGASSGEYRLDARGYGCWTLLDGIPLSWMPTDDHSYSARVRVAQEYFGDPADYDYSVVRMVWAHPATTIAKMVQNLPRWFVELGRRHVVLPLPVAAILLVGLVWMARSRRRRGTCLQLVAMVVMTVPVTAFYTNAEYMTPAFVSASVGIACGLVLITSCVARVCRLSGINLSRRWGARIGLIALCMLMECLLLRGGGLLSDFNSKRAIAEKIDETVSALQLSAVLLDPYWMELDSYCQTDISNRNIQLREWRAQQDRTGSPLPWPFGVETTDVMQLIDQVTSDGKAMLPVVIWSDDEDSQRIVQRRQERWIRRGYAVIDTFNTDRSGGAFCFVILAPPELATGDDRG
ncbi:MAG: hypothetical protein VX346_20005 [Planctomycetota bacterium]|nr:hypothetical protein [Planctomycetota bacterium]